LGARVEAVGMTNNGSLVYGLISGGQEIYLADLDPASGKISNPVLISDRIPGGNLGSAFSPDGSILAYVTHLPGRAQAEITLRDVATGQERALPARWDVQKWRTCVCWTPDGKSVLTLHNSGLNSREMVLTDIESGAQTLIHRQDEIRNPLHPCFSPDGKRLFFIHRRWPADEWYVKSLDIATRQVSILTRLARNIDGLAVSPDGRTLAVISHDQRANKNALLLMPAAGGEFRQVAEMPGGSGAVLPLAFSPDGRFVYLVSRGLVRVDLSSGAIESTGLQMPQIFSPSIHPSGRKIAFQAGVPTTELWIAENFIKSWPSPRPAR
jgi:Tol biopolymer transport system component